MTNSDCCPRSSVNICWYPATSAAVERVSLSNRSDHAGSPCSHDASTTGIGTGVSQVQWYHC